MRLLLVASCAHTRSHSILPALVFASRHPQPRQELDEDEVPAASSPGALCAAVLAWREGSVTAAVYIPALGTCAAP